MGEAAHRDTETFTEQQWELNSTSCTSSITKECQGVPTRSSSVCRGLAAPRPEMFYSARLELPAWPPLGAICRSHCQLTGVILKAAIQPLQSFPNSIFQPAIWMIGKLQPCCTILCDINVIAIKPMRRNPRKQRCVVAAFSSLSPQKSSSSGRARQGKEEEFPELEGLQEHGSSTHPRGHTGIPASSLTSDFPAAHTGQSCSEEQATAKSGPGIQASSW